MRVIFGSLIWVAMIVGACFAGRSYLANSGNVPEQLTQFLMTPRRSVELTFDDYEILRVGDPIVVYENEIAVIIGTIRQLDSLDSTEADLAYTQKAYAELYAAAPKLQEGDYLTYHHTPESVEWVVQMMLPPETRRKIGQLIIDAYRQHQTEIFSALQPIVEKSVREGADVIREAFRESVAARESQIRALGERYQSELVEEQLVPLVQDEIWPIIERETQPMAVQIGEEIWQKASMWRFGWRYIYDSSPLPRRDLVKKEFERFLDSTAVPIIQSHLPDIIRMQQTLLRKVSNNDKVREVVSDMLQKITRDPEFQTLVNGIMRDVFIKNDRLKAVIEQNWNSPEAQEALDLTNRRLDPTVTAIGQTLFGSPHQRITPEFSRVLRNRVLHKDDRWLVLNLQSDRRPDANIPTTLPVKPGVTGTENPFHRPARRTD
jgi:hypothetical protein